MHACMVTAAGGVPWPAYSIYALMEWSLVFLDVGWDATSVLDFAHISIVVLDNAPAAPYGGPHAVGLACGKRLRSPPAASPGRRAAPVPTITEPKRLNSGRGLDLSLLPSISLCTPLQEIGTLCRGCLCP